MRDEDRIDEERVRLAESVKTHEARTGWIAVDLDGTLAHYDRWRGSMHIGAPIPLMVERVKGWIAAGREVKIFTARVSRSYSDWKENEAAIRAWCFEQFDRALEVTAEKDGRMAELWDDRAVGIIMNTGEVAGFPIEPFVNKPAALRLSPEKRAELGQSIAANDRERRAEEALDRLAAARKG